MKSRVLFLQILIYHALQTEISQKYSRNQIKTEFLPPLILDLVLLVNFLSLSSTKPATSSEIWQDFKTTVIFVTHDIEEAVLLGDRILVMGVNPGHIKKDIAINLQRPRHIDDTLTPEFIQISRQVLATIREETLKSMEC